MLNNVVPVTALLLIIDDCPRNTEENVHTQSVTQVFMFQVPKQKYHISLRSNQVYDISERKVFRHLGDV